MRARTRTRTGARTTALLVLAAALLGLGTAAPAGAATPYRVSMTLAKTTVVLGEGLYVTGAVSPATPGARLQVQQVVSGAWRTVTQPAVAQDGTYRVAVRPTAAGLARYRVVKAASGRYAQGVAGEQSVHVYRWLQLADRPVVQDDNGGPVVDGSATIDGTTYARSTARTSSKPHEVRSTSYDLARRCTRFEAVVGLRDDSRSDVREQVDVLGDDDEVLHTGPYALGQSEAVAVDLRGQLRLELRHLRLSGAGTVYPAFGDARVLCAF